MSVDSSKPSSIDDEVDLSVVFKAIGDFFRKILIGIVNIFKFYFRYKYVLLILIIIGVGLGYFYESFTEKTYRNNLLVAPNFGSVEFLYSKINTIDSKIKQEDSTFLKDIFGNHYKQVRSLEIEPVIDIYNFMSSNETYKDVFELLFEEESSIDFVSDPINSRNFKFHHVFLDVNGEENHENLSLKLLEFLNKNSYFSEVKELSINNLRFQLKENDNIISQIDTLIQNTNNTNTIPSGITEFNYSDNVGLNELLTKKKTLIDLKKALMSSIVIQSDVVKLIDSNYKVMNTEDFIGNDKRKLFPLMLVIAFSLIFLLKYLIKKSKSLT